MQVIRIEEISLQLDENEDLLKSKISKILAINESEILSYSVVKKAIDSRKKNILFVYSVDVKVKDIKKIKKWDKRHRARIYEPFVYEEKRAKNTDKKTASKKRKNSRTTPVAPAPISVGRTDR